MAENPIPEELKSDHLFLLIGGNPLPNYVAARLLAKDNATIYLLHTDATGEIAQTLKEQIETPPSNVTVIVDEMDEADESLIENKLMTIVTEIKKSSKRSIGLNYTGGTKPMSVHAYRIFKKEFPNACFSYLDARSLRMYLKSGDQPTQKPCAGDLVKMSFSDMVSLHSYELLTVRQNPQFPELFRALAQVHASRDGLHEWKGDWNKQKHSQGWLKTQPLTTLPTLTTYPSLAPIITAFNQLGGTPESIARHMGFEQLESCRKYFKGDWLGEYTLEELIKIKDKVGVHEHGISLQPVPKALVNSQNQKKNFELDIAAMRGYQLFAISCIASNHADGETKKHLFEVYVRARQLGGDEARIALVCCVEHPDLVRKEIESSWDAQGKIRVFGRCDLPNLAKGLAAWFETANTEKAS